MGTHILCIK